MSGGRFWLYEAFLVLAVLSGIYLWAVNGSTVSAFCVGANTVFLIWAIDGRLDARLERKRVSS